MNTLELLASQRDAALPILTHQYYSPGPVMGEQACFGDPVYLDGMKAFQVPIGLTIRERNRALRGVYVGMIVCYNSGEPFVDLQHWQRETRIATPFEELDEMTAVYHLNVLSRLTGVRSL